MPEARLGTPLVASNAILSISQAEAGAGRQEMTDLDLADLVTDIADIDQAVAEDKAIALSIERSQPTRLRGNRHLLHRFVRLEQSRTTPGNGLGLSLVSAVAGLHNGSLILGDNNPGLRAELILGLPAQETAPKSVSGP